MELLRLKCPGCHSTDIQYHSPYSTKNHGDRVIYKCEHCPVYFSETKNTLMEGLKTPVRLFCVICQIGLPRMNYPAASCEVSNPQTRKPSCCVPLWPASLAGWIIVCLGYVLRADLRTTPTACLGDAAADRLFHCPAA